MHKESPIKNPPPVPIPEIVSPSPQIRALPLQRYHERIGKTFKASCELWIIVNDFLPLYYHEEAEDIDLELLLEDIKRIYQRLLAWTDSLPTELSRCEDALPFVLNLQ